MPTMERHGLNVESLPFLYLRMVRDQGIKPCGYGLSSRRVHQLTRRASVGHLGVGPSREPYQGSHFNRNVMTRRIVENRTRPAHV